LKKIKTLFCVTLVAAVVVFSGFAPGDNTITSDPELGQND